MLNYSIMRLEENGIEEFCLDIEYQVKNGICTMPLFIMTLTPEGDPAIDKAGLLCAVYEKYKARLDAVGEPSKAQYGVRELIPLSDDVKRYSDVYHLRDEVYKDIMFPGVTSYKNELGGTVVVFARNTDFDYNLVDAFGFLNETRKNQLVRILSDLDALPVYCPEDAEILMKTARMQDGKLLCALLDMSLDPIEELQLVIRGDVKSIARLNCNGKFENVAFTREGERFTLDIKVDPFDPLILVVE